METQQPGDPGNVATTLAWVSVACGVFSWLLAAVIPVGIDLAGIIFGVLALRRVPDSSQGGRRIAIWGLVISGAKLLAMVALVAWLFIAFSINPVAH